ncbi:uncharacterized protein FA14DRAFT_153317 [Meira miltonrushii]|uniref:Uncharacterized protein n=1 Tax=Meira miltonrushii TaxID=1280837 RepID=A0A316VPB2_9BASI|nr:uncharacterized protein FA14DRAFT_153317 [Meira miltonrushii]PWN37971.1 hypothetical protein FA14DRAFT_153317 [Meira miltonrushii]
MFKYISLALPFLVSLQMVHAFTNGYKWTEEGAVAHCGTDVGQQCIQVEKSPDGFTMKNDANLDIECTPSGLCAFAFDFDRQFANVTVNCSGPNSTPVGRNIFATFGKTEVYSKGTEYAYFYVYGEQTSAMWESDPKWTIASRADVPHYSSKKAETLHVKCSVDQ